MAVWPAFPVAGRIGWKLGGLFIAKPNSTDLNALRALIKAGSVTPSVDRVITLDLVPDAIRDLNRGRVYGKIVIAT